MNVRTTVWNSGVVFLAPLTVGLVVLFGWSVGAWRAGGYPLAASVLGAQVVFLVAPICAGAAAVVGRRATGPVWTLVATRSDFTVLAWWCTPLVLLGWAGVLIGEWLVFQQDGIGFRPDVEVTGVAFLSVTSAVIAGYAAGTLLTSSIAAPLMLVATYTVLAFPRAMEPLWLRHVVAIQDGCCAASQTLDPRAVLAPTIAAIGVASAALLVVAQRRTPRPARAFLRVGALGAVVASLMAATAVVRGLGPDPVVPREGALTCEGDASAIRYCVWPEHRDALDRLPPASSTAAAIADQLGLDVPRTLTEQIDPAEADAATFVASPAADDATLWAAFFGALFPAAPGGCPDAPSEVQAAVYSGEMVGKAWWSQAGLSALGVEFDAQTYLAGNALRDFNALHALPEASQAAWLNQAAAAIAQCAPPPGVPGP